jgi:hypothetical protein
MTQTATTTHPNETTAKEPPEPLRHLVCRCQVPVLEGRARCGVRVKSNAESASRFKPMDLCVICQDHSNEATPCKHCGKPAT